MHEIKKDIKPTLERYKRMKDYGYWIKNPNKKAYKNNQTFHNLYYIFK